MNDKTLAQSIAADVRVLDARMSTVEFGQKSRERYGVARNLMAQAIVEGKHANRLAMQEVKAGKAVSR